MSLRANHCNGCGADLDYEGADGDLYSRVLGVEYDHGHRCRYDGVSEWECPDCGRREGRWSGRVLEEGEFEPPFGGLR